MSGDGTVNFESGGYTSGQAADSPPNPTIPDVPPPGGSPVDAMYALLVAAANGDDSANDAELLGLHGDREGQYADALGKFPMNDASAAGELGSPDMTQTIGQIVPAIAGAITGAVGGAVSAVTQVPQALTQAGQSGMQAAMSAAQSAGSAGLDDTSLDSLDDSSLFGDEYGYDSGAGGGGGSSSGGGEGGGGDETGPTSSLGPPAVPLSTFPAAAPPVNITPGGPVTPTPTNTSPMGTPMPMGGMGAAGAGAAGNADKSDTKKVVPPVITNGKPVAGRLIPNRLEAPVVRETSAKRPIRPLLSDSEGEKTK
ncbi:Uncharacterised protein [Mycobacteroides abscessus subsp. abscessus]|nr:Uncharacterised protein [Mycobacteroides abscessus subsp. abscessus]